MIEKKIKEIAPIIEEKLIEAISCSKTQFNEHYKAMEYSLLAGGKRLRPFIMNQFYKAAGGKGDNCLNFAAALEMIHTYSLIHDDLPCMDDDDFRRGRPSCHKKFNEATALLAGDGLLTGAFNFAAKTKGIDTELVLKGISILSELAGADGMIGGQVIDLALENASPNADTVLNMYSLKTGALLVSAAKIGTLLGGGNDEMIKSAEKYAKYLGLAFQIQDDILDEVGDEKLLGKPVGSDAQKNKSTYVSLVGLENAKGDVVRFTEMAKSALCCFNSDVSILIQLADYLINRKF